MEDSGTKKVELAKITIENDDYFRISNVDEMRPFFMSIVSDSDHWMFISSNGGLSAGRINAQFALFPYYTDDKITESADITGSKSIFQVHQEGGTAIWEPFSYRYEGQYSITRNLYKSIYGNKIIFEEINHDLELAFKYQWSSSDTYGFVKTSRFTNNGECKRNITVLDGLQNIVPYGVPSDLQNTSSNLVDAYKRSELNISTGLGIYALSAIIVDRAEPSEALKANTVWSSGLKDPLMLLSSQQLDLFRKRRALTAESDIKAEKGAFFVSQNIQLSAGQSEEWMIVANVNQAHTDIALLNHLLAAPESLSAKVKEDIRLGTSRLNQLNVAADGLQLTSDPLRDARHYSNALFNIMRGGTFDFNYQIDKWDFEKYLDAANQVSYQKNKEEVDNLSNQFDINELRRIASLSDDPTFKRLCYEYLPLKFSRRHGDPSRPWNVFSINTKDQTTGSKILDYEGNWRDIFQNWEALALSFPGFIESMIHKFLNATTFDGYNPYRVTKGGFDWETVEEDNPWSYIGYWGDHQIIYLLKFLEFYENVSPGQLQALFENNVFVYANVPYKIKSYEDILANSKDTIIFDAAEDSNIRKRKEVIGADGALLRDASDQTYNVNFFEKILATTLAKISNYIPEGGIWMNTQRPEWNDANNALVGNGVSMVTLYYLYRFLKFFQKLCQADKTKEVVVSEELGAYFNEVRGALESNTALLSTNINNRDRKKILDLLGRAGSNYRDKIYRDDFSGRKTGLDLNTFKSFLSTTLSYFEHTIRANRREDGLYHAYNLMTSSEERIDIDYLYEMLEGQVGVLSSGYLTSAEVVKVLDALKESKLFRKDQYSYLLYPNKDLPLFREKNIIDAKAVESSKLLKRLVEASNDSIITRDINGEYHFNGNLKNGGDLNSALGQLDQDRYSSLLQSERQLVLDIFEAIFDHKSFTGRSGTFFGYEGLGSIYWHMVSKLQLAVYECCNKAIEQSEDPVIIGRLLDHYYEINAGLGVHKSPELYGAFPTDPYSHTPANKGAQQPGMTGQVKEDIISRFGELGVIVRDGRLSFIPHMLRKEEFISNKTSFEYYDVSLTKRTLPLPDNSLCFTFCQVPIIYELDETDYIEIRKNDSNVIRQNGRQLDIETSKEIFYRTGVIDYLVIHINPSILK